MARVPMVTRTIVTTKVNVMCLDIVNGEPFNKEFTLPRTYKTDKEILKVISEQFDNDEHKAVHVVNKEEILTLYGMTEQVFIENAEVLPPRTTKEETEN